ncbi:MAG: hypothetical protein GWN73_20040, partial [Actinobacteria bacterium]|nr:hypothetical protein [Actinomycetota bacterium]NIU67589.1 hypothetical protein [Actinomycetota bacterium]NIW32722.1 hypothetical protein [Actinomycetota bacterium]
MARSVTPLTLVALFAGGCAFIDDYSRFTFDGGTGPTDGSIDVVGDAAPPDGTTDTGPPPETCDAPCLADAFLDFSTEQGSEPLAWRYEAQLFADHLDYFPLVQGNHRGLDGWVGSPAPPAILPCGDASAPCAAAGELVLDASSDTGPVLLTTVGMAGRYAVEVSARPIGDAPAALWV